MRLRYLLRGWALARVLAFGMLVACTESRAAFHDDTAARADLVLTSGGVEGSSCALGLDPEPGLAAAMRVAAARWSAATGCDIGVRSGAVPVVFVEQPRLADGTPKRAVTIWSAGVLARIEYRKSGFVEHTAEVLLAHEVAHALGMREHVASGVGADPVLLDARIDAATLDAVCGVWQCAAFNPER